MKKKIISALLVLVLCLSLPISVLAAPDLNYVVDEVGYLAGSEVDLLNEQAAAIYDERDAGIFFVYTTAEDLESYDVAQLVGGVISGWGRRDFRVGPT